MTANAENPEMNQVRRSLGLSTVFKSLDPYTSYTVSVSSYNENKKTHKDAMVSMPLHTKMSTAAKVSLGILTAPTVIGPIAIAITQAGDENIIPSDEEFVDN